MVARIEDQERQLRSNLAEVREFMRRKTPDIVRVPMFKNLVGNGGFDSDTVWTKGTGWTISGGKATSASGATGSLLSPYDAGLFVGSPYRITLDVTVGTAGNLLVSLAGSASASWGDTSGSKSGIFSMGASTSQAVNIFANTTFQGDVDNVSLWEVDPSDNAPWLRLPYGHRVGKRGFVFRDGPRLMSNEYEEIFHGDQAFIKPLVAPGVNTEFDVYCGIGA